jgi:uncharacterized protein YndB with AHSA1/START domain
MQQITISTLANTTLAKAWQAYTEPGHITKWNHASEDWHSPRASVDLRNGGAFSFRMEAKDGSVGFDFAGVYDEIVPLKKIAYTFGDRKATVLFTEENDAVRVTVSFDPETEHPLELQRDGWQAILNNFGKHAETI